MAGCAVLAVGTRVTLLLFPLLHTALSPARVPGLSSPVCPSTLLSGTCPCTSMLASAHIPKSYLYPVTAWERNKHLPSLGVDQLTHICLIYPREVEILPHRWNQLRSPPLFPVKGEHFLSRQNRSGLTETTASFDSPGLPKLKRVYVLLGMEFHCFLLFACRSWPLQPAIHQCVCAAGEKCCWPRWWLRDEKGWSAQWFLLFPLSVDTWGAPFSLQLGKMSTEASPRWK